MGKKYLDTKQSTIEAAVLDVWVDAAEEQKAIRSAARMFVDAEFEEDVEAPEPPPKEASDSQQAKWLKKKLAATKRKEEEAEEEEAKKYADKLLAKTGKINPEWTKYQNLSIANRLVKWGQDKPIPSKYMAGRAAAPIRDPEPDTAQPAVPPKTG